MKILFYLSCCNGEMLPLETHIFAYKLYNSAYVLIYEHVCTFSKCSCRFCGCCADLAKSWSQLRQVWDELVAAIQHCEKEKGKVKIITVFTRTDKKKIKPPVFMIKQYRKLEFLVPNVSVTQGTTLSLQDFFCRELLSVLWWKRCSLLFIMAC